jgi:hypothetical protein
VNQRVAGFVQPAGRARRIAIASPDFKDDAATANGRHAVAHRAAGAVECRPQPFLGRLDFGEILEPEPKFAELDWRDGRQWRSRRGWHLARDVPDHHHGPYAEGAEKGSFHCGCADGRTISSPRMK